MSTSEQKSIWLCRLSSSLLLCITLLFPLKLLGAEQTVPQTEQTVPQTEQPVPQTEQPVPQTEQPVPQTEQPAPQPQQSDRFDSMDAPRDYLSGKIASYASSIDRFFGGDRHYQESNQSVVQLDLIRVAGYGGDRKFALAARANLRLPATEGRLRLLLETDPENNITDQPIQGQAVPTQSQAVLRNQVVAPASYGLAARYETAVANVWHFSTDGGLKFPIPVKPFVRTRGSFSAQMGEWRLKAAESVYWFNTLGVGETTELDLERFISEPVLFRATSTATWLNDKQNLDLRQDLSIYHTLNDRNALLYQASVIGVSNPAYAVTDYVVLLLYRYRLHREWLFFELSPQLHFPQVMKYQSSPALSMRLEILFDESR